MIIPITYGDGNEKIIGRVYDQDGKVYLEFMPGLSLNCEQIFKMLGGAHIIPIDYKTHAKEIYVNKAEILKLSLGEGSLNLVMRDISKAEETVVNMEKAEPSL